MLAKVQGIYFTTLAMSTQPPYCILRTASSNAAKLDGFQAIKVGNRQLWQKELNNFENVIFYPDLRYKKYKLQIMGWPENSQGDTVLAEIYGGWESKPIEVDHTSIYFRDAKAELEAEGWECVEREGFRRVIPIVDIEKFEGPPPEARF